MPAPGSAKARKRICSFRLARTTASTAFDDCSAHAALCDTGPAVCEFLFASFMRLQCAMFISFIFMCIFFRFVSSLHSPAGSYAKGLSQALRYVSSIYGHSDAHWKSLLGLCVGMQVLLLPHFASLVFEENA